MGFIELERSDGIATLVLNRGKVNALNGIVVDELGGLLTTLENDRQTKSVILTGNGRFFSFGFDIPEFLPFTRDRFALYLTRFTALYTYLFLYPKPVVAALNGHTIAGGCMLALACDYRVMALGKAKISLNEIGFGSSVFAGSTEMLRFWVGSAKATEVLYSGGMYSAEEAKNVGLVQEVTTEKNVLSSAREVAQNLAAKSPEAFASIKSLLRKPVAEEMGRREDQSIKEFLDIWYSEATRANLQNIKIY